MHSTTGTLILATLACGAFAAVSCPVSNGLTIVSNGKSFVIECNTDHADGDLTSMTVEVNNLQQCIDNCALNSACVDVSLSGTSCYLKSSLGAAVSNGVWGARLLPSTTTTTTTSTSSASASASGQPCLALPSAYTDVNGGTYKVSCSYDYYGNDLKAVSANRFSNCFAACFQTTGCVAFSYVGGSGAGTCYLKSSIGNGGGSNSGVDAAVLATLASSSSSSSVSRTSSTTSTSITISTSSSITSSSTTSSSTTASSASPSSTVYVRNAGKRGLVYTNGTLTLPYSQAGQNSQVSWAYNYYYLPATNGPNGTASGPGGMSANKDFNPALTFIPMLFRGDDTYTGSLWLNGGAQAAINNGADSLMSFNEPDLCDAGSACMTIPQSVAGFQKYFQPFAGKAKLGAPAVSSSIKAAQGLQYLDWFIGNCTGCQIDFINLHWYSSVYNFNYFQSYMQTAYAMFGKPIWVTEYGSDGSYDPEAQIEFFMQETEQWMDAVPYIQRYAYFIDAPGSLINPDGNGLSAQGAIFNNFTEPCADWNQKNGAYNTSGCNT
ncbi:Uu.00g084110.m01.CDS01 [Anthostomella pinea]|uniref:Uu.00g084110.m01.CDS01 n=1 Tax=Anthostomella pinea TaxID=933095 RepID=A0AAI8VMU8_9PEZI|nr:Uu.00g084110.m01.CDS01 [Anthostomella pinea]